MRTSLLLFGLLSATTFLLAAGCGDGGSSSTNTGGGSSSTTDPTGGGGTGGTTTGGSGGGTTTTGTTTGTMTGGEGHLLISEIAVAPEGGEFIEIHNPTGAAVSLADHYLSDNSTYPSVTSGVWMPETGNPGTDFLARFPANAAIPAGGYVVIATDPGFQAAYGKCPDFILDKDALPCGGAMVPALLETADGSITMGSNLSNNREMVVLFTWSGDVSDPVRDVDYLTWGDTFDAGSRADKTGLAGYLPDTPPAQQKGAQAPAALQSIERCAATEVGEKPSGGNGITGHDETSEDLAMSFKLAIAPTPGAKNGCP